jgi:hypothetical protein
VSATVRNVLIVIALAAVVFAVPGGGQGATFIGRALSTTINVVFVLILMRLYREHRVTIFSLGDRHRALLYGAVGVAVFAMAARARLWDTGAGLLLWFAMIAGASYAVVAVYRHWRTYSF